MLTVHQTDENVVRWCWSSTPTRRRTNQHQQLIRGRVGHRNLHRDGRRDEGCDAGGHALLPIHRDQRCNVFRLDRDGCRRWDDVDRVLLQRLSDNSAIRGEHVNRLAALNADDGVWHHRDG